VTEWRYLADGDGGDENLKDYPIEEESAELTNRSVINNTMLYQEVAGVDKIKLRSRTVARCSTAPIPTAARSVGIIEPVRRTRNSAPQTKVRPHAGCKQRTAVQAKEPDDQTPAAQ